jgi:PAS domain S-box-containing protein
MHKCFVITATFLTLIIHVSVAQYTPLDRCVQDSLYRIMPHESEIQKAEIYLELAQLSDTVPEKSFNYIVLALRIAILENNYTLKARTRLAMGDYFSKSRKFIQAQEHYLAAWNIYHKIPATEGELTVLVRIGALNKNLGNYTNALTYFQKGLEIAQQTKNLVFQGQFLDLMGLTYQQMKNYNKAMLHYLEALSIFRRIGENLSELNVQNNIGSLMMVQGQYNEALTLYNRLIIMTDTTNGQLMGTLYTRIAHIYSQQNNHINALKYDQKALKIRQQVHSVEAVNSSLINIAGDYYLLGKLDSGKVYMEKGLQMAQNHKRRNLVENGYSHLYRYYLNQGDYKEALTYYDRYVSETEIITQERDKSNFSILEANQHIQRIRESENRLIKQHEIQDLNIGIQMFQFIFVQVITVLAGILMLVLIFLFFFNRRVRRNMQEMNVKLTGEIMERKVTEQQAGERERQYRFLTENSGDFITQMDSQMKRVFASPASVKVYGYEPDEMLHKSPYDTTHPDFYAFAEANVRDIIETRSSRQFTYLATKKDGSHFWAESVLNPLFDPSTGEFKGFVAVTRDVQERKTKEFEIMEGTKQKENLLKEIHHRVKNNFAILVSLINMQMAQSKNAGLLQSLTNLQLRIRSMALVHEMLYRSKDFENISFLAYLRSLASVIAGTYSRHDIVLTFEADDTVMDIEAAIPLGLIVNEILSNAYIHAFPDNRAGNIRISFNYNPEKRMNTLAFQDDGIGMPAGLNPDQLQTMGLQIVQILCKQIEGTLVVKNNPGASFTITFQSS